MFNIGDLVKIKKYNIQGYIVDIREKKQLCIVEEEKRDSNGNYPLHDCFFNELEIVQ